MLSQLKFTQKIGVLIGVAVAGLALFVVLSAVQTKQRIESARMELLKSAVESVYSVVAGYHAMAVAGEMSMEDARAAAKQAVKVSRFGGADGRAEYFYIWRMDGVSVMHPIRLEWAGQNKMEALKDGKGRFTIKDIVSGLRGSSDGRAFVDTDFPRPGQQEPVPKIQYVMEFKAWNWIVGSGLYMDDVAAVVQRALLETLLLGLAILAAISVVGYAVARSVRQQFGGDPAFAMQAMNEASKGNLGVDVGKPAKGSLLFALHEMVASLRATASINTASQEIASGNQDLSARTEQAASNLEESAAAAEGLKDQAQRLAPVIQIFRFEAGALALSR